MRFISTLCVIAVAAAAGALAQQTASPPRADNQELLQMFEQDQSDRMPADKKPVEGSFIGPRDQARRARVLELYKNGVPQTGADYYHSAMILQHGYTPEDYLLAHELCVVAIGKGEERATWLAAASEDRFLMKIGRPQRFGTQRRADGPGAPMLLYTMDVSATAVTDEMRRVFKVKPPVR